MKPAVERLILCVLALNLLTFLLFGADKLRAKRHRWRIREATLLTLSVFGGSVGAMAAMYLFRHKTNAKRHPAFAWGIPLAFLGQLALLLWLTR